MSRKLKPWRHGTPSPRLRHITPFWVLGWISDRYHVCWALVVTWKVHGSSDSWTDNLAADCDTNIGCYCNKYKGSCDLGDDVDRTKPF